MKALFCVVLGDSEYKSNVSVHRKTPASMRLYAVDLLRIMGRDLCQTN